MIRVLIAEDSLTTRTLLEEILQSDPDIQVVGQAKNGVEAVELTQTLRPDLVTMDLHMPLMDGLEATKEIMITAPTPIVIITGSSTQAEVEGSMHALRAGALEVVSKPPGPGSPAFDEAARKLIATIKSMAGVKVVRHWRPRAPREAFRGRQDQRPSNTRVIAIVSSTGGPAALLQILRELPGDFPAPILAAQHITPGFTIGLATWLNSECNLHVKLAEHGEALAPHTVFLAPDGRHLGVTPSVIALSDAPPVAGFRPSGTYLFESVARVFGSRVVGIILTGMGSDGVVGLRAVRAAGGCVLAQDEASCVVFGMPKAAIAAGLVDEVLPLDSIASRLVAMSEKW